MNWSSRRVLLVVSSAAAGVIVAGTLTAVAYAGSPSRSGDALYGCVSVRSGALRVVDPQRSRPCSTRGPFREYAVTLNQAAGLPGPRGPRGPAGDGFDSLDALEGLPCNVGTEDEGEVTIIIAPPEQGSGVRMICETDATVLTPLPPVVVAPPPASSRSSESDAVGPRGGLRANQQVTVLRCRADDRDVTHMPSGGRAGGDVVDLEVKS